MHDKTMTFSVHDDRENEMKEILTTVYDALKQNAEELTQIGVLKEGTDATKFADNAYIFFDDVPDAPESDASTDTATKSTNASSASFQPAAAAEAEDDCCSGKITKPAQDTNAKA